MLDTPPPPRHALVTAAGWLLTAVIACLVWLIGVFVLHAINLSGEFARATDKTNGVVTGVGELDYYIRDIVTALACAVMILILLRNLPKLFAGSSGARNRVLVVGMLTGALCVVSDTLYGVTTIVTPNKYDADSFTNALARIQASDLPLAVNDLTKAAMVGAPILALTMAILLLNPTSTRYFQLMRRTGHY